MTPHAPSELPITDPGVLRKHGTLPHIKVVGCLVFVYLEEHEEYPWPVRYGPGDVTVQGETVFREET